MNATNNFNERKASSTFTRLAPIERMRAEGLETSNRLMAVPFFIITFSMTALISLSLYHFRISEQQHSFFVTLTTFGSLATLVGFCLLWRARTKALLIFSVVAALALGLIAPLGW